jgi:hypothetical protein
VQSPRIDVDTAQSTMASSSKVKKAMTAMSATSVPQSLRERLGHDATIGLMEYVNAEQAEWSDRVLNISVERFERRLAEELADLRVALVREIHETHSATTRWAFVFWATQVTAFGAFLFFVFRTGAR